MSSLFQTSAPPHPGIGTLQKHTHSPLPSGPSMFSLDGKTKAQKTGDSVGRPELHLYARKADKTHIQFESRLVASASRTENVRVQGGF